jgi:hypothetical protein
MLKKLAQTPKHMMKSNLVKNFSKLNIIDVHELAAAGDAATLSKHRKLDLDMKQEETGNTPLHTAMKFGHAKFALELLKRGADIDAINNEGQTCTQCAKDDQTIRKLIQMAVTIRPTTSTAPKETKPREKEPCYLNSLGLCKFGDDCKTGPHTNEPFNIDKWYKSGGIVPYCFIDNVLHILIGKEVMYRDNDYSWGSYCGKREPTDQDSIQTCVREFCEESVATFLPDIDHTKLSMQEQLSASIAYIRQLAEEQITKNPKSSLYIQQGKCRVLILEVPHVTKDRFLEMREKNHRSENRIGGTEKVDFEWIPATEFLDHFTTNRKEKVMNDKIFNSFGILCMLSSGKFLRSLIKN